MTENTICEICTDSDREDSVICVVEEPKDIYAFEKTNSFKGWFIIPPSSFTPIEFPLNCKGILIKTSM